MNKSSKLSVRTMASVAMLAAVSFVLMLFDFSVPFMPGFIKMDFSELPALIGSFALGPVAGVMVCFVKNLLHLFVTSTGGVGELSNFVLGAVFVSVAGVIYKKNKTRKGALIGIIVGAVVALAVAIVGNIIVTPFYAHMTTAQVVALIVPALLPFNALKFTIHGVVTFLIYKPISNLLNR